MKIGFIYGLLCPIEEKIRYVGQTLNLNWRLCRHKREARKKTGRLTHKEAWLKSLFNKGLLDSLEIIVIEECSLDVIDDREIYWIADYKKSNYLTNLAEGGKGLVLKGKNHPMYGKKHSVESIKKMRECKLGIKNPMFGKAYQRTNETKVKISEALKSSKKLKLSRQSFEYKEKQAAINHIDDVYLLDEKLTIIQKAKSCKEISGFLNCTYANVKNARRDKRKCKGYWVVYSMDYENFKQEQNKL